jgi:Flp pilus assembly protein TadD
VAAPHVSLGGELLADGKDDEAIAEYREAIKIDPENASAHDNLDLALERAGRLKKP